MHGLEPDYHGEVEFVYLDIDDPRTDPFKQQLGYQYQPHLFLLDGDGNIVEQWVGPVPAATLAEALDRVSG